MKITYLGDIMPLRDDDFNPREVKHLAGLKGILSQSDFVVANLEAPILHDITRPEVRIWRYRFASPYAVAADVKDAGVTHACVCNNHCLDQGFAGLMETIACVKETGMVPVGAVNNLSEPPYAILEKEGIKVALLASTYGTNAHLNGERLKMKEACYLNMHQEQELYNPIVRWLWRRFPRAYWHVMGLVGDPDSGTRKPYEMQQCSFFKRQRLKAAIRRMKVTEQPDVFVAYPHEGGQHRRVPMLKAKRVLDWFLAQGADAVICNHEHLVQGSETVDGRLVTYCLGNVVSYLGLYDRFDDNRENLSIMLHQYVERDARGKITIRYTFGVTKTFIGKDGKAETRPMHELIAEAATPEARRALEEELLVIGKRFAGETWEPEALAAPELAFTPPSR